MTGFAVSLPSVRAVDHDAERMVAAAHGDVEAFNGLVASHQDFLYGVAVWATSDAMLAEDALQDGLFRAYSRAAFYRGEGPVRAWLARVVLNACRDAQRWHRRRRAGPSRRPTRSVPTPPATHIARAPRPRACAPPPRRPRPPESGPADRPRALRRARPRVRGDRDRDLSPDRHREVTHPSCAPLPAGTHGRAPRPVRRLITTRSEPPKGLYPKVPVRIRLIVPGKLSRPTVTLVP